MKTNIKNIIPLTEARIRIFQITNLVQKSGVYFTLTLNGRPKAVLLSAKSFDFLLDESRNKVLFGNQKSIYQISPLDFSLFKVSENVKKYSTDNLNLLEDFIFGQTIKHISNDFAKPISARESLFASKFAIEVSDSLKTLNEKVDFRKAKKDKKILKQIKDKIQDILNSNENKMMISISDLDFINNLIEKLVDSNI